MELSNRAYDTLNWIVKILLPALTTLYVALGQLWGLPFVEPVAGTLAAFTVALGALLVKSNANYRNQDTVSDGVLSFSTDDADKPLVSVQLETPVADLYGKTVATFRVDSR